MGMASTLLSFSLSPTRRRMLTVFISAFTVLLQCQVSLQLDLGQCNRSLGMESGAIKDVAITASSAYDSGSVGPQHGRLRNDKNGGAWCPRQMVSRDAKEYLEVNMDELHVISAVRTQGRFGNGQGQEYAEEYMIEYWRPGFVKWIRWKSHVGKELLSGNTNTYTVVEQKLEPPVIATKIRLLPYSDHVRTVCMRVELVGCKSTDGLLSYSGPQGLKRGPEMNLSDRTYDGREDAGILTHGLGQLLDGRKGQDNFRVDTGHGKAYEWVGWRNDTVGWAGHPLELVFEFDKVRNFSAAHLHTNNLYTKDVQVFSHAKIFLSIGGNIYYGEPVHFSYMPDLILEHARNVTIKLHNRIGKFIKMQLYFASRWILLSEVSFDSVVANGNYSVGEEDSIPESEFNLPDRNYISEHTQYRDQVEEHDRDQEAGREFPLQRDEVKTISAKTNRHSPLPAGNDGPIDETSKPYIGFVIGVLTVVILILKAAIVFIVLRNRRLKGNTLTIATNAIANDSHNNIKHFDGDNVKMEECDKTALYQDTLHPIYNAPSAQPQVLPQYQQKHSPHQLHSPDYTEVPDVLNKDYTNSTLLGRDYTASTLHVTSSVHSFLPQPPPPIPPPPTGYYATDEIRENLNIESPSDSLRSKLSRHFLLPLSPDLHPQLEDVHVEMLHYDQMQVIEKLGTNRFGDFHLCKVQQAYDDPRLVVVQTLRFEELQKNFDEDVRALGRLKDPNVAQLLGGRLDSQPFCAVREYFEMGDLCQFLQEHVAETTTPLTSSANMLSYGCLVYMATQIASGMKCLESYRFVHKDLAARNCLVGSCYQIKISDLGICRDAYAADYCQIALTASVGGDGGESGVSHHPVPIRWMAWESILLGKFTTKSDVWSFAVTLWEILTFAREQPFEDLSDEKVVENVSHFYQDDGKHMLLSVPINCPKEIFDLMCECWQRNEADRPNFREIHLFLQRKNLGYSPELH